MYVCKYKVRISISTYKLIYPSYNKWSVMLKSTRKAAIWNEHFGLAITPFLPRPFTIFLVIGNSFSSETKSDLFPSGNKIGQYDADFHTGAIRAPRVPSFSILFITGVIKRGGWTIQFISPDQFTLNDSTASVPGTQMFQLTRIHLVF